MYRRTKKYSAARQEAMQRGRSQSRMDQPAPDYPVGSQGLNSATILSTHD
jgi:hypothetical protein